MRKPVAAFQALIFDKDVFLAGQDGSVPNKNNGVIAVAVVVCDDGAVFRMLPEPDDQGRDWKMLPAVPGTPRDPATDGYGDYPNFGAEYLVDSVDGSACFAILADAVEHQIHLEEMGKESVVYEKAIISRSENTRDPEG